MESRVMEHIEAAKYVGYLWYSNEKEPKVFDGNETVPEINLDEKENPFIIEGNLWDEDGGRKSIMIRYVDGKYLVRKTQVTEEELKGISSSQAYGSESHIATTCKDYLVHRIGGVKCLRFLQYWKAEADRMCEEMFVLRPSKLVFIGFVKNEEKEK